MDGIAERPPEGGSRALALALTSLRICRAKHRRCRLYLDTIYLTQVSWADPRSCLKPLAGFIIYRGPLPQASFLGGYYQG
jgi:hypothetical protein